jgi:hypothetical protein
MRTKNNSKTPVYQSAKAAAVGMGIPIGVIKWAKSQGAPGTTGSRIWPAKLLPWLETHQPDKDEPVLNKDQAVLMRVLEQVRDLRRKNDEKERVLVNRAWVAERMAAACSEWIRCRQMGKDTRCLTLSAEHGVQVAALRTMYDQTTEDGGLVLRSLSSVFVESNQPKP